MSSRLAILFVLMLISAVSGAKTVEKNSFQADFSSEAGRVYRSQGNAHDVQKDKRAEAIALYEKLLGSDAVVEAAGVEDSSSASGAPTSK